MKIIHATPFSKVIWYPEYRLLETIHSDISDMTDEKYKAEVLEATALVEQLKPIYGNLMNTQNFTYIVTPDLQVWIDKYITPRHLAIGVRKLAFVLSSDIFTNISVEQTMEEQNSSKFISEFFYDRDAAFAWLKS